MVRVLMLAIYRKLDAKSASEAAAASSSSSSSSSENKSPGLEATAIKLAEVTDLSDVSFWKRSVLLENLVFGCRTCVAHTGNGVRQSIGMTKIPFVAHVYCRMDGLAGVVVTDQEYPDRVAYSLLHKTMTEFDEKCKGKWVNQKTDANITPKFMTDDLAKYQDPSQDTLHRVQSQLDDVKDIMHKNIEQVLANHADLEELAEKSSDLSRTSKEFYGKSSDLNSCCRF